MWAPPLFTLALAAVGIYWLIRLPIDAVPDITNNQVRVITIVFIESTHIY